MQLAKAEEVSSKYEKLVHRLEGEDKVAQASIVNLRQKLQVNVIIPCSLHYTIMCASSSTDAPLKESRMQQQMYRASPTLTFGFWPVQRTVVDNYFVATRSASLLDAYEDQISSMFLRNTFDRAYLPVLDEPRGMMDPSSLNPGSDWWTRKNQANHNNIPVLCLDP